MNFTTINLRIDRNLAHTVYSAHGARGHSRLARALPAPGCFSAIASYFEAVCGHAFARAAQRKIGVYISR